MLRRPRCPTANLSTTTTHVRPTAPSTLQALCLFQAVSLHRGWFTVLDSTTTSAIHNCNFTNNVAGWGGAVHLWSWAGGLPAIPHRFSDCFFDSNTALGYGGGGLGGWNGYAVLSRCTFTRNQGLNGGAIHTNPGCDLRISGSLITGMAVSC